MINCFGTGIGLTDEELDEMEKQATLEKLDELLPLLDPLYCDDFDDADDIKPLPPEKSGPVSDWLKMW